MSKSFVITILFILDSVFSMSQEYFNNRYNITGEWLWDYSTTIIAENDRYLIGAETGSTDNIHKRRIAIVQIDLLGNQQWVKIYAEPGVHYAAGYPGFLIPTGDSLYALSGTKGSPYPGWRRDQGLLMRLNNNLDTLWSRLYGDVIEPCDSAYIFRQLICLEDHGYAIIGDFMNSIEWRPQIYIARTDSSGNIMWNKWLGDTSGLYYPYRVSACSDNGYVITGMYYTTTLQSGDPVLFKLDSLGNTQWSLNIGSPFLDYYPFVDTTHDGNIIVGTIISDSSLSTDNYYGRIYYLKLDNEGNMIWDRKYGRSHISNRLWSVKVLENGNIISAGSRVRVYPAWPYRLGWMLCTNSEGDSLWYREYIFLHEEDSENYFYDVAPAFDNGFIACGAVYPVPPDTGTQDTWVVKVDSIGCESPEYCWTAIGESAFNQVEKGKWMAYPIPASNYIIIEVVGDVLRKGTQITIYDIYGKEVICEILSVDADSWRTYVSGYSPGIYVARIVFMNEVIGKVKFVVKR